MKILPVACENGVCVCVRECVSQSKQFKLETVTHTHTHTDKAEQTAPQTRCTNIQCGGRQSNLLWTLVGQLQQGDSRGERGEGRGSRQATGNRELDMGHGNNCTCHMAQQIPTKTQRKKENEKQNV